MFLLLKVGDLRLALQRAEQTAARKEDYLRHEISELQQVWSKLSETV
jgi:predicted  nucleic acid-binding Zn-ribbon protein